MKDTDVETVKDTDLETVKDIGVKKGERYRFETDKGYRCRNR